MPTQLLAIGTDGTASSDLVLAAGDVVTVALKDAAGPTLPNNARVLVQLKDDGGQYFTQTELWSPGQTSLLLFGPGTYRFKRSSGNRASVGVFSA